LVFASVTGTGIEGAAEADGFVIVVVSTLVESVWLVIWDSHCLSPACIVSARWLFSAFIGFDSISPREFVETSVDSDETGGNEPVKSLGEELASRWLLGSCGLC
jgi:hypothetical protein